MYLYTPQNRPPAYAAVPKGWVLMERPNDWFPLRTDLPVSNYKWGVIGYAEKLSDEDVKSYELTPLQQIS